MNHSLLMFGKWICQSFISSPRLHKRLNEHLSRKFLLKSYFVIKCLRTISYFLKICYEFYLSFNNTLFKYPRIGLVESWCIFHVFLYFIWISFNSTTSVVFAWGFNFFCHHSVSVVGFFSLQISHLNLLIWNHTEPN